MLHKPKISTLNHFHSIPRYFMHSIPIGSIVALLALNLVLINPVIQSQTYALEEDVGRNTESSTLTTEKENNSNNIANNTNNNSSTSSSVRDTATNDREEISNNNDLDTVEREDSTVSKASPLASSTDYGIDTLANSNVTLNITPGDGGNGEQQDAITAASAESTAYRSHNIEVVLDESTNYALYISYAGSHDALRLEGSNAYLTGADGNTPANMPENSWGFAWGATTDTDSNMTYYTMPQYNNLATTIEQGLLQSSNEHKGSFKKKLVFAAKFGSNATAGHYKTSALLSLTAAPQDIVPTIDDIFQLQQMTPDICNASIIGEAGRATDQRDDNKYTIAKLQDGKCWMTTNLRITRESIAAKDPGNTVGSLTSANSNVSSSYSIPKSTGMWYTEGSSDHNRQSVYYAGDENRGAYYTWCAATAGSCTSTSWNDEANASVCPKGWRLPSWREYRNLASTGYEKVDTNDDIDVFDGYNIGGAFFPTTGRVGGTMYNYSIENINSTGYYWSSSAGGTGGVAYFQVFSVDTMPNVSSASNMYGCTIRCIAE